MELKIYTDGACSGNPGPGGWGAILFWNKDSVKELGGAAPSTTNNRMEMTAVIEALDFAQRELGERLEIEIYSDSKYLIQGIQNWIRGWKQNGWKTSAGDAVQNQDLWQILDKKVQGFQKAPIWTYVPGHSGFAPNERCDEIAVAYSKGGSPMLFVGAAGNYGLDLMSAKILNRERRAPSRSSQKKALYYLSLVNGVLTRHDTWESCERVIRGVSGAKFRKVTSLEEERSILSDWNLRP